MNSIEDIAKMAIEEVGAELAQMENSRIPAKAPKPLRAANDTNTASKQAAELNAASVINDNENSLNITNVHNDTLAPAYEYSEARVFGEVGKSQKKPMNITSAETSSADLLGEAGIAELDALSNTAQNAVDKNFLANATLTANTAIGMASINALDGASPQDTSSNSEKEYLLALKERLEVLFAGLKNGEGNLSLRLDLTIRFLEFLLANTNERLTKLPK